MLCNKIPNLKQRILKKMLPFKLRAVFEMRAILQVKRPRGPYFLTLDLAGFEAIASGAVGKIH